MERGEDGEEGEGSRQRDETPKSNRKSRNKMNKAPNTFGARQSKNTGSIRGGKGRRSSKREREELKKIDSTISF